MDERGIIMYNFYNYSMGKDSMIRVKKIYKQMSSLPKKSHILSKKEVVQKERTTLNFYDVLCKEELKSQFENIK